VSYASLITTVFGKRPIWLYELNVNGSTYYLTSAAEDYVDEDARTWVSTAISHTRFRVTSAIGRAETQLVMPQSNPIAQEFVDDTGYEDNYVKIYHEFQDQTPKARVQKFVGRVIAGRPVFTRITLLAENRMTEMRRKGLAAVIQRPCRHALYHTKDGYGCGLNIANWQVSGSLTALGTGNTVATVSAASSFATGYFSGGVLTWNGKRQMIVRHTGSSLRLLAPVFGLAEALAASNPQSVQIAPGCNLTRNTCSSRFNNLANFGGFPWIDETPFDGKTIF
jgi:uncharacterized phage protein (TIGR02218 family)